MAMEFFYPEEIFYLEEMQSGCFVCVLLFPMQYVLIQRVLAVFDIAQVPLNICNAKKTGRTSCEQLAVAGQQTRVPPN